MKYQSLIRSKPEWPSIPVWPSLLIACSVAGAVVVVVISSQRTLSELELTLLQFFILGLSLAGSYYFGLRSTRLAARELVKNHARSAFRRSLFLYQSLSRLALAIDRERERSEEVQNTVRTLDVLEAIVTEQILTADDALEDWRDIVPEDVAEIESQLKERRTGKKRGA